MTFTALEAVLLACFCSIVSGLAIRLLMGGKYMTRDECRVRHATEQQANEGLSRQMQELQRELRQYQQDTSNKLNTVFRMVRGLVVYSDLDGQTKEQILNERGRGSGG